MAYTNLIAEVNREFTRLLREKRMTPRGHRLMQDCRRARLDYDAACRELADARRMRFTPAGWYEEHIAGRRVNQRQVGMDSAYMRLRTELRRIRGTEG